MNRPIALTQDSIRVDVDFYDDDEKQKLLGYPTAAAMAQIIAQPLEVPMAEFLTYYLFHRKRLGTPDFHNYRPISDKLHIALSHLEGCIEPNGHSICTATGVTNQLNEISEHVGEAIGLAVMNRIHGLTEADWSPIPEQHGRGASPTFDFQIASDGQQFVQLEAKGSSVDDNQTQDANIKAQKRRIDEKKRKLVELDRTGGNLFSAAWRYGTIAAVDPRRDGNVRCWLTDPPAKKMDANPLQFRLLQRMRFLRYWISFISARSQLAAALATRVRDMEAIPDLFVLDELPLRKGNDQPFTFDFNYQNRGHSSFMANKSQVIGEPAGGLVVQPFKNSLFMLGFQEELLNVASSQKFETILRYKTEVESKDETVECKFSAGWFQNLNLPPSIINDAKSDGGYHTFNLTGRLHYSQEGLVFGVLPLPEK